MLVPPPQTTPGRLSDIARHLVLPVGIVSTGWPAVRDTCRGFGVEFDPWQDGAGRVILAKRADGSYACGIGGVVISIPRQVGKTFLIGAIVFALCLLRPGLTVLWTAHRLRTAAETFAKMQTFARRKKVKPHVAKIILGSGVEEIRFHNGSRVLFGARERGFGRGFDGVDIEVFDEAQILTENAIDDMVPATNTAANPLLLFVGTPPKPSDPAEVFRAKRDAALAGEEEDGAYIEMSADPGCDPNDRAQWAKANPSYPGRTNDAAMLRMKKNLTLDSFIREALGIWDDNKARSVIDPDDWAALAVDAAPAEGTPSYGVKFSPDGEEVAVSVALRPPEGPVHLEGVFARSMAGGTGWLEDWLAERWRKAGRIVVDGRAHAGAFVSALEKRGVRRVVRPTVDQVISAHSLLLGAVADRTITNVADEATDASIAGAGRRQIGKAGGWGLEPLSDDDDVTLAESIVLAHWGAAAERERKPRRVRVMR